MKRIMPTVATEECEMDEISVYCCARVGSRRERRWLRAIIKNNNKFYEAAHSVRLIGDLNDPKIRFRITLPRTRLDTLKFNIQNRLDDIFRLAGEYLESPISLSARPRKKRAFRYTIHGPYKGHLAHLRFMRRAEASVRHIGPNGELQTEQEALAMLWQTALA